MKYNRSEIMKSAWNLFKMFCKSIEKYRLSFSECLRRAWAEAKRTARVEAIIKSNGGLFRMDIGMARVLVNIGDRIVSGNTYKCKETLKQYGLKFNGSEKYWEGTRENITELVRQYAL